MDKPKPRLEAAWIEREAKLFEVGNYPDKGVVVERHQLAELVKRFQDPVPLLIEHAASPLELGYLAQVELKGDELYGTLHLSPEANALIENSGARSLSLGLAADLSRIMEVSLVKNPRVPSARLFADGIEFWTDLVPCEFDWKAAYDQLQTEKLAQQAQAEVDGWVSRGKLLPSQAPFARALLQQDRCVSFGDDDQSVRSLLIEMIERQPPHRLFQEHAPRPDTETEANLLLPEEAEFYRTHFPGIELGEIARRKPRGG